MILILQVNLCVQLFFFFNMAPQKLQTFRKTGSRATSSDKPTFFLWLCKLAEGTA